MRNLINRLLLFLCGAVFSGIEDVYRLFYGLATTKLFNEDAVKMVSDRLYVLVSIVILFAFAIKLIEAIVNPDLLGDSKKGVTGVLKRTVVGLLLIVAIPNMFNLAYYIQREIITTNLIEKIVFGRTDVSTDTNNASGILTSSIIRGFVYPIDQEGIPLTESYVCGDDEECNYPNKLVGVSPMYQKYVTIAGSAPNYDDLEDLQVSAEWDNGNPMYHISALLLLLVGIYVLYQVILMSFDAALRLVNLGILEIMAPLVIVAYMGGGTDYLTRWAKMVGSKFASIFVRIAALSFMILGLQLLFDRKSIFSNQSITFMFKLLIILGLLRLVKDLPDIFSKLFGVDIKADGGIKGRLGEMAGIGGLAQKAWGNVTSIPGRMVNKAWTGAKTGVKNVGKKAWGGTKGLAKTMGIAGGAAAAFGLKKFDEHVLGNAVTDTARSIANNRGFKYTVSGLKIARAGIKSGGKGTFKAVKETAEKEFEREIADSKAKAAKERKAKYNAETQRQVNQRMGGQYRINKNDGSLDAAASVEVGRSAGIANAGQVLALNTINSQQHLSDARKDYAKKYTDASYNRMTKQVEINQLQKEGQQREAVISYLEEKLQDPNLSAADKNHISNMITNARNGVYTNDAQIQSDFSQISFSDRSVVSNTMKGVIDSMSDMGANGQPNLQKQQLMEVWAKYQSEQINDADLQTELNNIGITGQQQNIIMQATHSPSLSAANTAEFMQVVQQNQGVYGDTDADRKTQLETATDELVDLEKKLSDISGKMEEQTKGLTGAEAEEFKNALKDADAFIRAEESSRTRNPGNWNTPNNQNQGGQGQGPAPAGPTPGGPTPGNPGGTP